MWEFWLNYAIVLLVLLPMPALQIQYVVTINGESIPQEAKYRKIWECYQYAYIEGFANLWNLGVVALHWILPFLLMLLVWSLILRRRNTTDEDDSTLADEIADGIADLIDYD
jgi:hypothetical protein